MGTVFRGRTGISRQRKLRMCVPGRVTSTREGMEVGGKEALEKFFTRPLKEGGGLRGAGFWSELIRKHISKKFKSRYNCQRISGERGGRRAGSRDHSSECHAGDQAVYPEGVGRLLGCSEERGGRMPTRQQQPTEAALQMLAGIMPSRASELCVFRKGGRKKVRYFGGNTDSSEPLIC